MAISLLMFAIGSFIVTSAIGLAATSDGAASVPAMAKSLKVNAGAPEHMPLAMRERLRG